MNLPVPPLILSPQERASPLWLMLMKEWGIRLEQMRSRLEGDLPESDAMKIRGRIQEIRSNMALNKELAAPE